MQGKNELIDEFISTVDSIYGVYLDSTLGLKLLIEYIQKMQNKSIKFIGQEATLEKLDKAEFMYGVGEPPQYKDTYDANILHITTQGELKQRNKENGVNYKNIGNLVIVLIYQLWEDKYRNTIAQSMGIEKNDLNSEIFGELRHLRRSIVHKNGLAINEVESKVELVHFKEGEEIYLRPDDIRMIVLQIKTYLELLKENSY